MVEGKDGTKTESPVSKHICLFKAGVYCSGQKNICGQHENTLLQKIPEGESMTLDKIRTHGLLKPHLFVSEKGLGMKLPSNKLTVRDIANTLGFNYPINVMDVESQTELIDWTMEDLVNYFETREVGTDKILNQISLEFTGTPLHEAVRSPSIVRELDWIDNVWPKSLKKNNGLHPKVQYYCLTSTAGCFTDFHVDFGGTSVWYHVLSGRKSFIIIPPTDKNLEKYEEWLCAPNQDSTYFPNLIDGEILKIDIQAGQTLLIPSGFIHGVYTPVDSIVFGGNFLHSFDIEKQIQIHCLETRTRVPKTFRFPYFVQLMFYAGSHFLKAMREDYENDDNGFNLSQHEMNGIPHLISALSQWSSSGGDAHRPGSICHASLHAAKMVGLLKPEFMISELKKYHDALTEKINVSSRRIKITIPTTSQKSKVPKIGLKNPLIKKEIYEQPNYVTESYNTTLSSKLAPLLKKAKNVKTNRKSHHFEEEEWVPYVSKKKNTFVSKETTKPRNILHISHWNKHVSTTTPGGEKKLSDTVCKKIIVRKRGTCAKTVKERLEGKFLK
uniref:JmjC domain-containing protein n=3 Tax=Corethron hystrix TaxID=216773 RepID=A0A7S1BNB5_9STRA|mmetsp:Transcript_32490/g.74783  ORF Transcript_32490/g.74783 Transcript_32490/m.74783 type:complete len:555 (+) Transcript_32490:392-2056(+)|eukprot:CAMPEP_0113312790 /NCGR_PEP_ID=MMETSP0010_2-20120614/9483_1 /TAXON_ID=216773 ORGANISM="Corethron hystrix, Strain 308" /NCGR_SAMPLE_ID=MMETSP0010_2 /ASSEMBLY_ACC=CAM_ASM_000155 /LENGTH=554 /DNA_ID=CAMNT_0000168693 /DNA_START=102 /DNA_END=1769 /DNA_ORIENTATION=+ /assembly_acc=CAM_ASM_000155